MGLSGLDVQELKAFAQQEGQSCGIDVTVRVTGDALFTLNMASPAGAHTESMLCSDVTAMKISIRRVIANKAKSWRLI